MIKLHWVATLTKWIEKTLYFRRDIKVISVLLTMWRSVISFLRGSESKEVNLAWMCWLGSEMVTLASCSAAAEHPVPARPILWPVSGDFKDFMGSVSLSCVLGSGKPRENQVKPRQSTSDIKSLIVIGKILRDYSTVGRRDRTENYLSNILPQITTLHADVSNSPSVRTINLIKMCVFGSSGNAD